MRYNEARSRLPSPVADEPAAKARQLVFKNLRLLGLDRRTLTDLILSVTVFVHHELENSNREIETIHEGMTNEEITKKLSYWIAWLLERRVRDELRKEFFQPHGGDTISIDWIDEGLQGGHEDLEKRVYIAEQMRCLWRIAMENTGAAKVANVLLSDFKDNFKNVMKGMRFNRQLIREKCPDINVDEGLRSLKAKLRDPPEVGKKLTPKRRRK